MGLTRINTNQLKSTIDTKIEKAADADLTAIADITDSARGYLKKIGKNEWAIDSASLLTVTPGSGQVLQTVSTVVPASSGTTTITLASIANNVPTTSHGVQIWTDTITPGSSSSKIKITGSFMYCASTSARQLVAAVFRGSTCIGVVGNITPTANTAIVPIVINLVDDPHTTSSTTYSVRVGTTASTTWYINKFTGSYFGGSIATSTIDLQELA